MKRSNLLSVTPNPNPNNGDSGYKIGGITVEFPYKPYGSQLAFMGRVISTLDRAKQQGHSHALLESPTGTGKTLSLLCSALAWQKNYASKAATGTALSDADPLIHGGGFIPEPGDSRSSEKYVKGTSARAQRKIIRPTIYYATRTHSQISQVIREYRKTSYRVPMAILASRRHYCTNKNVCSSDNIDEECKLLLNDDGRGCPEFKNAQKLRNHSSFQKGGCYEAHDIEDLVKVGRSAKGCSYFAAQTMAAEADLVFCPYSYVINPVIRRGMDIDIKGSILILDEAHNIEDIARDAGSFDVEKEILVALEADLEHLSRDHSIGETYQPLHQIIRGIINWIEDWFNNLSEDSKKFGDCTCWTGDKALKELQESYISQQNFPILKELASKAIKAAADAESSDDCLSGISALTLEGLFSSLTFLLASNGQNASDYQLALQFKKNTGDKWVVSLSLWCLNPGVIFKEIADIVSSVILTSGTLSPMGSFASELGVQFETCLESPHVIDVKSQLWAGVVSKSPGNQQLNASYKTCGCPFMDALGETLEEMFKVIPGGVLIFFPSYKLLNMVKTRWNDTKKWDKLNDQKILFVEPRGKEDKLETVLKSYYGSVHGNNTLSSKKIKKGQKRVVNQLSTEPFKNQEGAAFLAVFRGKVSEGIDFSDDHARAVIVVGIPFPNINDIQVIKKKNYNDSYRKSKNLLSGSEWYCHQAFRALNQAAGRCIRHRLDYGAIILIDERFNDDRNLAHISRWIRKSIKRYDTFDTSLKDLKTFFSGKVSIQQEECKKLMPTVLQKCNRDQIDWKITELCTKNISDNQNYDLPAKGLACDNVFAPSSISQYTYDAKLSCSQQRCSNRYLASSNESSDQCLLPEVKDTLEIIDSNSTTIQVSMQFKGEEPTPVISSIINSSETFDEGTLTLLAVTPERKESTCISNSEQGTCFSVNSHQNKQKKMNGMDTHNIASMCCIDSHSCFLDLQNHQRNKACFNDPSSEFEHSKFLYTSQSDKKIPICCKICINPLGLSEDNYLVICSLALSSKVYLNYILEYGPMSNCSPETLSLTKCTDIPVFIADRTSINQKLFKSIVDNVTQQHGIWSELDGCVFNVIFCPFCIDNNNITYLGVHILATDELNACYLNKVFFYADCLYIREGKATKEVINHVPGPATVNHTPRLAEIESFSYNNQQTRKTKLKLRRKA